MTRLLPLAALAALLVAFVTGATAAERKAYRYVDEKGNVVYSQTPPADGRDARKVDITPAQAGRYGHVVPPGPYDNPRQYSGQGDYEARMREQQRLREEAQRKRLAELEAECNRSRGTDCKNPETLRLIEAQKIPGGRQYRSPAN
jgi:hypothetical protein